MKQSFDDIIREKTKGYEAPVPPDAWDNIMNRKEKKRRFIFFWWILAALLGGGAVVLYNYSGNDAAVSKEQTISQRSHTVNNTSADNSRQTSGQSTETSNDTDKTGSDDKSASNINSSTTVVSQTGNTSNNVATGNTTTNFYIQAGNPKTKKTKANTEAGFDITNSNPAKGTRTITGNDDNVINSIAQQDQSTITTTTADPGKKATVNNQPPVGSNTITGIATTNSNNDQKLTIKQDTASATDSQQTVAEAPPIKLKKRTGNWKADIAVMPIVSFQKNSPLQELKRTSTEGLEKREFIADKAETSIEPGIAFNIALRKKLNAKTYIGAGMQYATFKEKVYLSGTETITSSSIVKRLEKDNNGISYLVDDTVETVSTGQRTIRALNSYQTISLPVFIQTNLIQKRSFSIDLSAGLYFNLMRSYQNSIDGIFANSYTNGLKQGRSQTATGVDIFTGLRFSTPWRKNWSLFAEPTLRYSFLRNNTRNMINAKYIHQAGLSVGATLSF